MDRVRLWWNETTDAREFYAVLTVICALVYALFWVINWMLVSVLNFTGLRFIVLAWVGYSLGTCIHLWQREKEERAQRREEEVDDQLL